MKLAALLNMFVLSVPDDGQLLRVPWRDDLRPVEGVLQGVYAHLGLAALWRSRAAQEAADERARGHFRRYRSWVAEAIGTLYGSGALTRDGHRFVDGMRATVEAWGHAG